MEQMRREFEAWISNMTKSDLHRGVMLDRYENGSYRHLATENKWEAWTASRATIEIELPKQNARYPFDEEFDDGYTAGKNGAIQDCADAIRAAGLAVKGDSK